MIGNQTEAEIFAHKIGATHILQYGYFNWLFLNDSMLVPRFIGSKHKVNIIYDEQNEKWGPWDDVRYMGLVSMCTKAIKVELRVIA